MVPEHDACGVALIVDRAGRASHDILARSLEALRRMTHRGAAGAPGESADGAGVLAAIPWDLFLADLPSVFATAPQRLAASCMLEEGRAADAMVAATLMLRRAGWGSVQWRTVPTYRGALPAQLRGSAPLFVQCFAVSRAHGAAWSPYRTRRLIEGRWRRQGLSGCTVSSLSDQTLVYKALATPAALPHVFSDLRDRRFTTPFAVVHQRFSTNTLPSWPLAQPFRTIAHNGEINTIRGNRLWADARQTDADALPRALRKGHALVSIDGSDSQSLDDTVELLRELGHSTPRALARLLPRAWEQDDSLPADLRAFYRHEACFAEPWEGPAAVVFADGHHAGAVVDRNGFRPLRTLETADGLVCVASEAGVVDVPAARVTRRDRLGPGEMLVVDLRTGILRHTTDALCDIAREANSADIVPPFVKPIRAESIAAPRVERGDLHRLHQLFGWTREEIELIVKPLAVAGHEAVGSMGDDVTLAALGSRSRPLADYFRQRFAQVTNPPLDPVREASVMSLRTLLGRRGGWHAGGPGPMLLELESPVLNDGDLASLLDNDDVRARVLPVGFVASSGAIGLRDALASLQATACASIRNGARIVVLSDRSLADDHAPIPALLAVAAVDLALRVEGLRLRASLVVETGDVRDAHHLATLCGFGASAVVPYLLHATAATMTDDETSVARCTAAIETGLLKVLSKLGICTIEGYIGARQFDTYGLDRSLTEAYFPGVSAVAGALTLERLASFAHQRHDAARRGGVLAHPGFHVFRRDGDHHAFNPVLVRRLHDAAGTEGDEAYRSFSALVDSRPAGAIRDLLTFRKRHPIPIEQVERADSICRRFFASAMSVGALSPEAHRTLAVAMNRLGGRSNSGEGGEEADRFIPESGVDARSATKQVASARFGVTPAYLIAADELQIKIAQGSKPGEGGQLPGVKVDAFIARLRHAQPGMTLLSPPPHHDIYSIEDLAQLIYDLRTFHPRARLNVKLVSQPGIGVVAAGVVKAGAHAIQISGHEGGTGASPRGSIKHAGGPWELGLAEAHRALVASGLRDRVVLQTDGGLQTGRDIAIAAALGAEEFGFGTAALVALGCVMARQCHLNTCPVGIASQRPDLRQRYAGTPEMLIRFLRLIAQDVREILAGLGLRRLSSLVGRADFLQTRHDARQGLDLSSIVVRKSRSRATRKVRMASLPETELTRALARASDGRLGVKPVTFIGAVRNTDRAIGSDLAGRLALRSGDKGTAQAPIEVRLTGSAGQSLWAFALPGMHVRVEGEANDGVGKGMHGGEIVIRPPGGNLVESPVLVGNAALYGATGGRMFVAGRAGERFAVRNSGAWAVVEGVGDHGCEYMTGGAVLVLGRTGRNFAAGMTGGVAYVFDEESGDAAARLNSATVCMRRGLGGEEPWVRAWLGEHHERTGSALAADLLRRWGVARELFWVVLPHADVRSAPIGLEASEGPALTSAPGFA